MGTARLLEGLGFEALATTSAGYAFSVGQQDNTIGRDQMMAHVAAIVSATGLPVSADLENRRLQAFQTAGADVLYAPGLIAADDIAAVVRAVDRPVNVVMGLQGASLSLAALSALGVKRVSVGSALSRAALGAFLRAAREMRGPRHLCVRRRGRELSGHQRHVQPMIQQSRPRMFHGWLVVAAAFSVTFVGFGSAYTFSAFVESLQKDFGASRGSVALAFSLAGFLYFGLGIVSGPLADRWGSRRSGDRGHAAAGSGAWSSQAVPAAWPEIYAAYGLGVGLGVGCSCSACPRRRAAMVHQTPRSGVRACRERDRCRHAGHAVVGRSVSSWPGGATHTSSLAVLPSWSASGCLS